MGRRSLKKIDPSLDLSRHLKSLDELPSPLEAEVCFGRSAPLEVEVGSGKGLFLASASAAHPERDFLGIEIAKKYARYAAAKLAKQRQANALVIAGDAHRVFSERLPAACAAAVHVYFPDPWWKERHRKRRIINPSFVAQVQRVLQPRGRLHFWTDVQEYYDTGLEIIKAASSLEGPIAVPELPAEHDLDYRTHFERRTRLHELEVYRAEFIARP